MKCRICGATLKKEGDICKNCYNTYKYNQILNNMGRKENVVYTIKRKYSPKFNILKNSEMLLLLLIIILAALGSYGTGIAILIIVACVAFFIAWMAYNKKRAIGTKTTFLETKLRFEAKYPLVDKEEEILYNDINDVAYFQTNAQKMCKVGDIRFYTKGFLNGLTIHDIPDIEENFEKIRDIINSTR